MTASFSNSPAKAFLDLLLSLFTQMACQRCGWNMVCPGQGSFKDNLKDESPARFLCSKHDVCSQESRMTGWLLPLESSQPNGVTDTSAAVL